MPPKYLAIIAFAVSGSKSPTTDKAALLGA
jgi:hypothetical protein